MTTALAVIKPRDVSEAKQLAVLLAQSAMLQPSLRGKPEDVFAIMLAGMELGLGPMQALRSISIIQGRPAMNAELMVGLAKQNKRCKYFRLVESTSERAVYETLQEGSPEPERAEYTMDDARREGLANKDNWKRMPAQMLRARASSALARLAYQDSVLGLVAREEMGQDAVDVSYEEVRPEPRPAEPTTPAPEWVAEEPVVTVTSGAAEASLPAVETIKKMFEGAKEVQFPVDDQSEREAMLAAEREETKRNMDDLHKMVNDILPGDDNKKKRKEQYERFGLRAQNPMKQFMTKTTEQQRLIMRMAERWYAITKSEMPQWGGGPPPSPEEAEAIKREEAKQQ